MTRRLSRAMPARLALALLLLLLGGCNAAQRLSEIGAPPRMSKIENPVAEPSYEPVALPMPQPEPLARQPNSLWRPGARAFFRDQRASRVGDILTVAITIEDQARINNQTSRSREASEDADLSNLLGIESHLGQVLPEAVDPSSLISLGSAANNTGKGSVNRSESIKLTVAAIVTQILPNGNLVVQGSQEVRVNYEMRVLTVSGVIRPQDISSENTVQHSQMAEARISYGGRGVISDVQQPRYGQQVFDVLFPF